MGAGGKDADLQTATVLQAVVLADSFSQQFRPVTYQMPKVLMPVANVPLIEYTLEFLAGGGVQEVFIFCCAHAAEVERYIRESELERRLATLKVHVLASKGQCFSTGDALREVEAHGGITNDFVLVPGDVVANVKLAPIIAAHKARRESDCDSVLTTLMTRVPPAHRSRRAGDETLVVLSGETGRMLQYEDGQKSVREHKLELPMELLQETDRLQVHRDLYDTHIDICAPELLALLQDNFDWQDLRRDLLPGILGQFEMLGKTMYTHIIAGEYAARVHDPHTYDSVSRDILRRWTYPLVPDANLLPGSSYRCGRGCVYKEDGVVLARNCAVAGASAIGAGASVGDGASVSASVLGRGCAIGAGVAVERSYLWRDVTIEEGATVRGSILCDGVVVEKGAVVETGCILGPGVRVPAGVTLPAHSRHTTLSADVLRKLAEELDDDDDALSDVSEPQDAAAATPSAGAAGGAGGGGCAGGGLSGGSLGTLWRIVAGPSSMCCERSAASGPIADELSEPEEEDYGEDELEDEEALEEEQFASEVETRYCLTSRLLCTNQSSFYRPLQPTLPALLQYDCTSIAQYTTPPDPPLYMPYNIPYWL